MTVRLTARREGRARRPGGVATLALVLIALAVMGAAGAASSSPTTWRAKVDPAVLARATSGETEFLVELARQADLSGAYALRTKEAKGRFVYKRLTATARTTQAPLRSRLAQLGVRHRAYWIVNAIWVRGDLDALEAMGSRPEVARVFPNGRGRLVRPLPAGRAGDSSARRKRTAAAEPGLVQVGAPQVWALGYTGQGAVVASADTGVLYTHPALLGKYRGWDGTAANHDYNWHDAIASPGGGVGCPAPSPVPCDDFGHGSHTTGTMVGDDGAGNQIGMAPGAKWIACRNMDQGVGTVATYLNCMQWLMAPTKIDGTGADTTKSPDVVNNSWSCTPSEGCNVPQSVLRSQVAASRAAGIVYVSSAGNSGSACGTVDSPLGIYGNAFTVGAVVTGTNTIATFSSRGPADDDGQKNMKPNISAPGTDTRSSTRTGYGNLSGTSMSAPHVAGLVALLISAKPSLAGNVAMIENIIEQSAVPLTTSPGCDGDSPTQVPNNVYGWGRIDAYAAVQLALGPTAVTVSSFAATKTLNGVALRWRTASESRGLGFDVFRSPSAKGRFVKLTRTLIPSRPVPTAATYRYVDRSARAGRAYVYRLDAVGLDGVRRAIATVRVRAR